MKELGTMFPYGHNDTIDDEPKTTEIHINIALKFRVLSRKNRCVRHEKLHDCISEIKTMDFISEQKNMLEITITKAPNFNRISLSSITKSSLKSVHQLLKDLLSINIFHVLT